MRITIALVALTACFGSAFAITGVQYYQDTVIANSNGTSLNHPSPQQYNDAAQKYKAVVQDHTGKMYTGYGSSQAIARTHAMAICERHSNGSSCVSVNLINGKPAKPNTYYQKKYTAPKYQEIKYKAPAYRQNHYHPSNTAQ